MIIRNKRHFLVVVIFVLVIALIEAVLYLIIWPNLPTTGYLGEYGQSNITLKRLENIIVGVIALIVYVSILFYNKFKKRKKLKK